MNQVLFTILIEGCVLLYVEESDVQHFDRKTRLFPDWLTHNLTQFVSGVAQDPGANDSSNALSLESGGQLEQG